MAAMAADTIGSEPPAPTAGTLPLVAIFPFISKGHTIPLLHLARLLHRRRLATFTFFTTPLNAPFIRASLNDLLPPPAVVELPFSRDAPGLSPGVESTGQLPSMSDFNAFCRATERLREPFKRALAALQPPAAFLVSDSFHFLTVDSAAAFGIPRLVFDGMGWFVQTVSTLVGVGMPHAGLISNVKPFQVPGFPQIWLTKADFPPPLDDPDSHGLEKDFPLEVIEATAKSRGIIRNSFHDMEAAFSEHWNRHFPIKGWSVGPLCLAAVALEAGGGGARPRSPAVVGGWETWRLQSEDGRHGELSVTARRVMEHGGSSWCSLEEMVKEVCGKKELRRILIHIGSKLVTSSRSGSDLDLLVSDPVNYDVHISQVPKRPSLVLIGCRFSVSDECLSDIT
ncbi:hypothetical protein Taro_023243 [Colocasia esculenta]|uniref:Uncharacterized protein n=1 Tax=Colocasia esculenta TaxID=4460 RepID=A0A843VGT9_COLES|nr:hypothetical protein [Colocasia esculenta]